MLTVVVVYFQQDYRISTVYLTYLHIEREHTVIAEPQSNANLHFKAEYNFEGYATF